MAITAATLDGNVPDEDQDLVQEYIEALIVSSDILHISYTSQDLKLRLSQDDPHRVTAVIEQNLNRNATALSQAVTSNNKSDPAQMPRTLTELTKSIATLKSDLATARLDITHESSTVHELYKQILASSIRLLEQTIHGSVSRASKAKAEYLATVAEGMAKKLGIQHQQLLAQLYSGDLQETLQERSAEMSREDRTTRKKIAIAEEKLDQYRAGRGMEGLANEYAEILVETARVREEIARLESQQVA